MLLSNQPSRIQLPFANSGTKNTIPVPSQIGITDGLASFTDGFPPLTMTPIASGGKPPFGADFNGVLNAITAIQRWQSGGGLFTYDAAWSTANSGYPKGALLLKADGSGYWRNKVDGNTTNPDTGGANWTDVFGGLVNIQVFTASGTYTPTPGTRAVMVRAVGGGASGTSTTATGGTTWSSGNGGQAGSYGEGYYTSGFSGATVTIGAGGAAPTASNTSNAGGTTSFGALLSCPGGAAGPSNLTLSTGTNYVNTVLQTMPSASGGLLTIPGEPGAAAFSTGSQTGSGRGGNSPLGTGGMPVSNLNSPGNAGQGYGSGGSGATCGISQPVQAGGAGAPGVVIVFEYL